MSSRIARVTVTFAPNDHYGAWAKEVWEQTGIIGNITTDGWTKLNETDVLVLVGPGHTTPAQREAITSWCLEGHGAVVCIGGTWGFDQYLGVTEVPKPAIFSRATFTSEHERFAELGQFDFIGGPRLTSTGRSMVMAQTPDGENLVCASGHVFLFVPDIGKSLGLFGMGSSVGSHKIGPGDGTITPENGFLRAHDGCNFEWSERTDFDDSKAFATPHLDLMREALVRTVILASETAKANLAICWHFPDNAPGATVCSIDWDSSQADHMRRLIATLAKYGVVGTWLGMPSGQPQELYRGLRQWNHDFGLLYKPENGQLKSEQMRIQYVNISRLSGSRTMAACRGYEGYWHGHTVIYEGIEGAGGLVSFSKGGLQKGSIGFTFGTCRPYFPVSRTQRSIPVLEVPFIVADPGVVTPISFINHAIEKTKSVGGCFHFTVRPSISANPGFEEGMEAMLSGLRQNRFQSFLGERLYEFERARRSFKFVPRGLSMNLISEKSCSGVTVMIQGNHQPVSSGKRMSPTTVTRYGTTFSCATVDVEARTQTGILFNPLSQAA